MAARANGSWREIPPLGHSRSDRGGARSVELVIVFASTSAAMRSEATSALVPLGRALDNQWARGQHLSHRRARRRQLTHPAGVKGSADCADLPQQWAEAVRFYLITKLGIGARKGGSQGHGCKHLKNARDPLAAENRREKFVNVSQGEGMKAPQR